MTSVLQSSTNKKLIAIILSAFLATFTISRLFVYLVLGHWMPDFFLTIKGVHIHHFAYGFIILTLVGLFLILKRPEPDSSSFKWATWFYGVGLGLAVDEFGMWIRLEDYYWTRQSYDAMIIVALLLLNIAYFKLVVKWVYEIIKSIKDWIRK